MSFNSGEWLAQKKEELVRLLFNNEFGITDFRHTHIPIEYDLLQSPQAMEKFNQYRQALKTLFTTEDLRSSIDYFYSDKDKKPLLNLLRQILRCYGYKLHRISEYKGTTDGIKTYKSHYNIIPKEQVAPNIIDDELASTIFLTSNDEPPRPKLKLTLKN